MGEKTVKTARLPERPPTSIVAHDNAVLVLWRGEGPGIAIPFAAIARALGVPPERLTDRTREDYVRNHLERILALASDRLRAGERGLIELHSLERDAFERG